MSWVRSSTIIYGLLLAAAPGVLTVSAVRADVGQPSSSVTSSSQQLTAFSSEELKAFAGASVRMPEAIATAQKYSRGWVVEAKFDVTTETPVYKMRTYADAAIWEGEIDAVSGQVNGAGKRIPVNELDEDARSELSGVVRVPTASLLQAVTLVENRVSGKVISAEVEEIDGENAYELILFKDGSLHRVIYRSRYH
jgi:uncharacterized membrane protein YkoI